MIENRAQRILVTIAVMGATLIQLLDITIVNVALPHMEGSLGAARDEITWVLTSYLVASAIIMPLTGYFTDRLGQKNFLLISIAGFVITSALCGAATTLSQLVFFRILQGVFGAALVPLSQTIMTNIYPPEERGTAMAIWGLGVMVGPVLGPTLGGYLTEVATWRWNFYINIPIGLLCFLLSWRVVPDTVKRERAMDWLGLFLISMTIGSTQFVLDRGTQDDWFNSRTICIGVFIAVISFLCFLSRSLNNDKTHVFDLAIFTDRNFTLSSLLIAFFGLSLFGTLVILPLLLESLLNYPVLTTGLLMAPRGIAGMFSMALVAKLLKYYDPRILISLGILLTSTGIYLGTFYSLEISNFWIVMPLIIQGLGLGFVFVPLSAVAFSTLPIHYRAEAAGLFSLLRTIGSSIGISIVSTLLARYSQLNWNQLSGFITPYSPHVYAYLSPLNLQPTDPLGYSILMQTFAKQAQIKAYINIYAFVGLTTLLMLPLVFSLKKTVLSKEIELSPE